MKLLSPPLAAVPPLFERCRALLERWPLTAPVCALRLAVVATAPTSRPAPPPDFLRWLHAELGPRVRVEGWEER